MGEHGNKLWSKRSPGWFAANAIVFVVLLVGLARLDRADGAGPAGAQATLDLEQVRPGWWETRRAIYGGTPARVLFRLPEGSRDAAAALAGDVWTEIERLGQVFSSFDPSSEVGRLNATAGERSVLLSRDLRRALATSKSLHAASGGAYDPTVWPLRQLWHSAVETQVPPTDADLAAALRRVGLDNVRLSPEGRATVPAGVQLDLGGVAKGDAVDRVEAVLRAAGVESGMIALGGDIATFGDNDGEPWRIGVQHPRDSDGLWGVVEVAHGLRVSTSGNYRQPLEIAGKTYYHIFDPRTGRPVPSRVEGVTALDARGRVTSAVLDGATTAMTVLGPEAGMALARRLDIDALILVAGPDGLREIMTDGFRSHYRRGEP